MSEDINNNSIHDSAVVKNSFLDINAKIYKYVNVLDSQIGKSISVGDGSIIKFSVIGDCCEIGRRNLVRNSKINRFVYTGENTHIMWTTIGQFCSISRNCDIGANQHNYSAITTMPTYKFKELLENKKVEHPNEEHLVIGNDVWIGQGATIVRKEKMSIGNGAVIGAGAVVTKSIPPYAIAVGVPARVIRYRFSEEIIQLLQEKEWWNFPIKTIKEIWGYLSCPDIGSIKELFAKIEEID